MIQKSSQPKLVLTTIQEIPSNLGPGMGQKIFTFPFLNEHGQLGFSMNCIADTPEQAAEELKGLLSAMLVEISMQFPKTTVPPKAT